MVHADAADAAVAAGQVPGAITISAITIYAITI